MVIVQRYNLFQFNIPTICNFSMWVFTHHLQLYSFTTKSKEKKLFRYSVSCMYKSILTFNFTIKCVLLNTPIYL